jgi:hypothetical protein
MDSMDNVRERFEALEQQTQQLIRNTRMGERRLRWWHIPWRVRSKSGFAIAIRKVTSISVFPGFFLFVTSANAQIELDFNSLPNLQGWTYYTSIGTPENAVFSVDGTSLHQNSFGIFDDPKYIWQEILPHAPFDLSCTGEAQHTAPVAVRQSPPIVAMVPSGPWRGGHVGTWLPDGEARGVLLLHHGHSAFDGGTYAPGNLIPVAEAFAAAGFLVYGLEMPPGEHEGIPIEEFLEASKEVLDTVKADDPHTPVYMVGLSGGGWTTTVLTATNARITRGYSVAGDHPVESVERGDWEQHIMDYPLLYAMAGDRLRHIYVWGDGCCFGHVTGDIGTPYVIDTSTQDHTISPWAVQWILEDITQLSTIE